MRDHLAPWAATVILAVLPCVALAEDYQPYDLSEQQVAVIEAALGKEMRDPYSANYEDVRAVVDASSMVYTCGFVNSKNALGAYTGRLPFYVALIPFEAPREPLAMMVLLSDSEAVIPQVFDTCRSFGVPLD